MSEKPSGRGGPVQALMWLGKRRSDLRQALRRFSLRRFNRIESGVLIFGDVAIEGEASIGERAILGPEVTIGKKVHIGPYARLSKISIGENSSIDYGVLCTGYGDGNIRMGRESYIGIRNILDWSSNISIGNFVHIAGPSTALWTHTSARMCLDGLPLARKDDKTRRPTAAITIEDNVYIGGNCTIYPGVTIHHHVIVAPNSAVTKDVPSYTMFGGVPAKEIKKIPPESS